MPLTETACENILVTLSAASGGYRDRVRLMAVFHACLDESGKFRDSQYISFCGYISDFKSWEMFSQEWDALRLKLGLPPIHMASLASQADLLIKFAGLIQKFALRTVGVAVDVGAFNSRSEKFKNRFRNGDPHYLAFYTVISSVDKLLDDRPESVSLICDDDEGTATSCYKLLALLKSQYPNLKKRFPSICFADDESYPPLQAADMLAYTARSVLVDKAQGKEIGAERLYKALTGQLAQPLLYDLEALVDLEARIEKRKV